MKDSEGKPCYIISMEQQGEEWIVQDARGRLYKLNLNDNPWEGKCYKQI